jgi:hypothetical protein
VQRIKGDRAVRNMELAKQLLYGGNLVGLLIDVDMRQDQVKFGVERVQQLGSFAVSEIVETSPERLSIKRNSASRSAARTVKKARGMAAEYLLDALRIKTLKDVADGGVGWCTLPVQTEGGVQS